MPRCIPQRCCRRRRQQLRQRQAQQQQQLYIFVTTHKSTQWMHIFTSVKCTSIVSRTWPSQVAFRCWLLNLNNCERFSISTSDVDITTLYSNTGEHTNWRPKRNRHSQNQLQRQWQNAAAANTTTAGWQVTLCDPIWHVSSRSGDGRPACKLLYGSLFPTTFYLCLAGSLCWSYSQSTSLAVQFCLDFCSESGTLTAQFASAYVSHLQPTANDNQMSDKTV